MKETELVEWAAGLSPFANLLLMAGEIQPYTAKMIWEAVLANRITDELAAEMLSAIVF